MAITVPEYGSPKVQAEPVPGVRINPAQNADEAFGGGASAAGVTAASRDLNTTAQRIYAQQQQNADEVAAQEADLKAGLLANRLNVDVQKLQGKDALGAPDYLQKEWQKGTEEITKDLGNDNQRAMVAKRMNARYMSLDGTVQTHVANEMKRYDTETTNAFTENARNEAAQNFQDPEKVKLSIFQQEQAMMMYARRNGLSDDVIKKSFADIKTDTHAAVIDSMLAADQVDMARKYYEENKAHIVGKEAKQYPAYIDAAEKRVVAEQKAAREQTYDTNMRQAMISMLDDKFSLGEAQRLYRNDQIKEADYFTLERRLKDPLLEYTRKVESDPIAFNEIRNTQLENAATPGTIDRMIAVRLADKQISKDDAKYLMKVNAGAPPSPRDQRVNSNAQAVREFGNRYFGNDNIFNKGTKDKNVEALVSDFYKRADADNLDGEKLDDLRNEVIGMHVKKNYPEISRLEDIPHIVVGIDGKVQKLLNPTQTTKVKPRYKIVMLPPPTEEKKPKK